MFNTWMNPFVFVFKEFYIGAALN